MYFLGEQVNNKEADEMEAIEAIKDRHMYRGVFQDKKVDRAILFRLIEAARWAPSGHNSQPWEFLIIDDQKIISEVVTIAIDTFTGVQKTRQDLKDWVRSWWQWLRWSDEELEAAGDGIYMRQMLRASWEEMINTESVEQIRTKILEILPPTRGVSKITNAPCLIFTLLKETGKLPNLSQDIMELTSIGAAMQNLRIAAHSLGLAVHELSLLYDVPATREGIAKRLGIPPHCRIVSAMRVGYPGAKDENLSTHVRRPLEKLLHWNHY